MIFGLEYQNLDSKENPQSQNSQQIRTLKRELDTSHHIHKNELGVDQDIKVRAKTIKPIEENRGGAL